MEHLINEVFLYLMGQMCQIFSIWHIWHRWYECYYWFFLINNQKIGSISAHNFSDPKPNKKQIYSHQNFLIPILIFIFPPIFNPNPISHQKFPLHFLTLAHYFSLSRIISHSLTYSPPTTALCHCLSLIQIHPFPQVTFQSCSVHSGFLTF